MTIASKLMLAAGGILVLTGAGTAIAAATSHDEAATSAARSPVTFVSSRFGGVAGLGRHAGMGMDRHGPGDDLAAAASYLGISTSDLITQLRSGKTPAQVADATSGKSAAGLIAALVAHEKQELADAVSAGKLTQAQADAISANLQQRITDLVNGVLHVHRPHGFHGPHGDWTGGPRI